MAEIVEELDLGKLVWLPLTLTALIVGYLSHQGLLLFHRED